MPSRIYHPLAAEQCCATRLQVVADTLAAFCQAVEKQRAEGKPADPHLVRVSHQNACEALYTALRRAAPLEPELFAAIACLQEQEEAVRELLPP